MKIDMAVNAGSNVVELGNVVTVLRQGVTFSMAGVPVDGAAGSFVNEANPGDRLVDTTNKILYINTNTKASPTWTKVGTQT